MLVAKEVDPDVGLDFADALAGFRWLPAREQEAVRLQVLDGLTQAEAGERMGCSKERVRQLRQAGLVKLRGLL